VAIAQNPTDWKHVEWAGGIGAVAGCDFAGIVEELGPEVDDGGRIKVGDRVATFTHGGVHGQHGAFAEYTTTSAGMLVRLPDSISALSWEEAAGVGIGGFTACQVLYQSLGVPTPLEPASERFPILVWSGASGVGQLAIQLAALGGLDVYTTASPKHHAFLQSLGAKVCFDYRDAEVGKKIKEATGEKLKYAIDCIGDAGSAQHISDAIASEGGKLALIIKYESKRPEVKAIHTLAYTLQPYDMPYPAPLPLNPAHVADGKAYAQLMTALLAQNPRKFKLVQPKVLPNGLASVADGLKLHKEGGVSGEKLTYRIADTPGL